jgi:3-hydroxyisobutyrate dehydrogenase-like beta-hydroxyacid dehydrogenase
MQTPQRVGFAGMGLMGSRMARHFITKGFPLAVWNRTPERCQPLVALGAKMAKTPRELAEMSDVVVTCVADPNAVGRIARPGFRYVETSTISPGLARRIAEVLRANGADMLEAPVTGSKIGAEKGTLLLMTGGSKELEQELMPVLMAFGAKAVHCGDVGQASTVKLIGNTVISFMLEGFCEGVVLGRKSGVSLETILEVVMASGFASPYYNFKGAALAKRDFDTHFSIDLLVKDQNLMLDEAHAHKVPMPGLAAIREVFQSARAQGWGEEDICAVVKALEKAAGVS